MSTPQSLELIIWNYIRNEYEGKHNGVQIPIALKHLVQQFSNKVIPSKMLTIQEDISFIQLTTSKLPSFKTAKFNLLYRGSDDKFTLVNFHKLCDNKGPTMCIIHNDVGNIFGGYTSKSWTSPSEKQKVYDDKAFLFLIKAYKESQEYPKIFKCKDPEHAVYHNKDSGPIFGKDHADCGEGHELSIESGWDKGDSYSYVNWSDDEEWAQTYDYFENEFHGAEDGNDGSFYYKVVDFEVFQLKD